MRAAVATAVALLSGASLGFGIAVCAEREAQVAGPPGWELSHPRIPARLARLAGEPLPAGGGWPLDSHGVLTQVAPGERLSARVRLPDAGRIELRLGREQGLALVADRVGDGAVQLMSLDRMVVEPSRPGEVRQVLSCEETLTLPPDPAVPVALGLRVAGDAAVLSVDGEETRCRALPVDGPQVAVRSGLRRVALLELTTGQETSSAPGPDWLRRALGAVVGALAAGLVLVGLAPRRRRTGSVALALAPGLPAAWLAGTDLVGGLQAMRIRADAPLHWGVGVPLAAVGLSLLTLVLARFLRRETALSAAAVAGAGALLALPGVLAFGLPGLAGAAVGAALALGLSWLAGRVGPRAVPSRAAAAALLAATATGGLAGLLDPRYGLAVAYAAAIGLCLGLLLWANLRADRVRAFNLLSLGLVVGMAASAEQALTWTDTGASLVGRSSRAAPPRGSADSASTAWDTFEALEERQEFTDYPAALYPVRPPPRQAPTRIVALGSSSTAGAFQNDDISEFWPADLDRLLGPEVEVINQGVGGWTSLHVRRYVETRADLLDPDIAVVYLGHNDLLSQTPRTYRDLYAAWKAGGAPSTAVSRALGGVHLYQLLRYGLQHLAGSADVVAVPPEHARDNLAAVVDVVRARGGRVLLVNEAVAPDPVVMAPYADVLAELAAGSDDVAFLDAGPVLTDPSQGSVFLDDCHLTRGGHQLLAQIVADALVAEGWVSARGGAQPPGGGGGPSGPPAPGPPPGPPVPSAPSGGR